MSPVENHVRTVRLAAFVSGAGLQLVLPRLSFSAVEDLYIRRNLCDCIGQTTSRTVNGWNFYVHLPP